MSSDDSVSLRGIELPTEEGLRYAERRCQHGASVAQQNNPLTFAAQTLSPYSGFDQRVNPRNPFNDNFYPSPFSPVPYGGGGGGVGFGDTSFRTGVQYPTSRTVPPYSTSFNYLNTGFGYPYPGYSNFGIPSGSPYVPFNPYDNTGGGFNPNNPFVGNRNFPTGVGIATPTTGIFSNTGRITPITTNAGFPFASPGKKKISI